MLIGYIDSTGKTIYATVKRLVDNYYLENSGFTFTSAPTFLNKRLLMVEGTGEELGYYSYSVNSTSWNDGVYDVKIHDGDNSNLVVGSSLVGMISGVETTLGNEVAIYHMDINFVTDIENETDEYLVTVFKNGVRLTSGVSAVEITVIGPDGISIIDGETMTEVTLAQFKYIASLTERQTAGNMYTVIVEATYGGQSINFSWNLGRDDI
jgi:hypothetical protein